MEERKPLTPSVRFQGRELDDDLERALRSLRVELSVRRPGVAELVYEDPDRGLFSKLPFGVADHLEILLPGPNNELTSVFVGEVTGLGVQDSVGLSEVHVEAHDARHRFALSSRVEAHLKTSHLAIVRSIASAHGLKLETTLTETEEPWILQRGTDYAFLNEVASTYGADWYVDGEVLHLVPERDDRPVPVSYETGVLRRFTVHHAAEDAVSEVEVRGWDPDLQQAIVGVAEAAPKASHLRSAAPFVAAGFRTATGAWGRKVRISSIPVRTQAEAERIAEALAARWSAAGLSSEGEAFSSPQIRPGGKVEIEGVAGPLTGTYLVTEVVHEFGGEEEVVTRFSTHTELPFHDGLAAGGPDGWTGAQGIAIGIVTNIDDLDGLGRVKVKLPTLGDQIESAWARVLVLGAGGGDQGARGLDVRPELNDEVLVAFEHGDPRFPVVLGGVYSAKHKPYESSRKTVDAGLVRARTLRTRNGHRLVMSDEDGSDDQMFISLLLADDETKLEVRQDGITVEAAEGTPLKLVSGKGSITLTDKGDIELAGEDITIKANGKLNLDSRELSAKGSTGASIDGGSKFEAKGKSASVQGMMSTEIKGGTVKIN